MGWHQEWRVAHVDRARALSSVSYRRQKHGTQQRLEGSPFAVLIMSAINWPVVRPHVHKIALDAARPGTVVTIDCGAFKPR
jgi:hypothetical protein